MKLHANAALSLKGRRELCRRVVEGERTLSEAAEAAEVSVRCAYLTDGWRKAATPLLTASTPVIAVQPLEKARNSIHHSSMPSAFSGGLAGSGRSRFFGTST